MVYPVVFGHIQLNLFCDVENILPRSFPALNWGSDLCPWQNFFIIEQVQLTNKGHVGVTELRREQG